jgi:hypothetical protein
VDEKARHDDADPADGQCYPGVPVACALCQDRHLAQVEEARLMMLVSLFLAFFSASLRFKAAWLPITCASAR